MIAIDGNIIVTSNECIAGNAQFLERSVQVSAYKECYNGSVYLYDKSFGNTGIIEEAHQLESPQSD